MIAKFTRNDLQEIVQLTGQLLEREDRFVCGCLLSNPIYKSNNQRGGISYVESEKYYQALTLRALLPSFRYMAKLEHETFDIALFEKDSDGPVAVGEMKRWMSATGKKEIPSIKQDIQKLSSCDCSQFLMIFTRCPRRDADQNVKTLLNDLECSEDRCLYKFNTVYPTNGEEFEEDGQFVVIGILIKQSPPSRAELKVGATGEGSIVDSVTQ